MNISARPTDSSINHINIMRKLLCVAILSIATLGTAQSPLTTLTGGTNQGNVGGGLYFDLAINSTLTINQIDFRCGANTAAGQGILDIFIGPSSYAGNVQNPALWTHVASVTTTVGPGLVATGMVTPAFALAPGNYGIAFKSNAFNHGYTNGTGCTSTTIPGSCSNSVHSTADMVFKGGAAQNNFLQGGIFTPRIFNGAIHYTLGGTPIRVAAWETYGKGCYAKYRSFYQFMPNPASLNIGIGDPVTALMLTFNGSGYDVTASATAVVPPTSPAVTLASSDSTFLATSVLPGNVLLNTIPHPKGGVLGFATDLEISTDGYIVPSPATMANDNIPTPVGLLNGAQRWAPYWKNLDPMAAGSSMHVEYNAAKTALLVTWLLVADQGSAVISTFQVAFFGNGNVEYRYGTMSKSGGGGRPIIIGYTEGNGALDPGNEVITAALPFSTFGIDNAPLSLAADKRPVLGTSINLMIDAIPTGSVAGGMLMGLIQLSPGVDLASIGMPGCSLNLQSIASAGFATPNTSATFALTIPNLPSLNGATLFAQSVTISAGFNNLGVLSSNGVSMKFGTL